MVIELPQDLEKFISEQVTRGRFATADEAIAEAVRLLRLQPALSVGGARTPEDVDCQLLARGLLSSLPNPAEDVDDDDEPISVEGEAVSETIIRERR
jgi:Arc/MetJ-type ribon-helix-helix transcriptional regulator